MSQEKLNKDIRSGKIIMNDNGHIAPLHDHTYLQIGKRFDDFTDGHCYLCGQRMHYEIKDKILTVQAWEYNERSNKILLPGRCEMEDHKKQEDPFEITLPTGQIVFANYFYMKSNRGGAFELPDNLRYNNEYDICFIKGRNNRAKYLAEKFNLAYGQMNTNLYVWRSNDQTKIFITEQIDDEDEDFKDFYKGTKADKAFNDEFRADKKLMGEIDTEVWCWEAADQSVIKKRGAVARCKLDTFSMKKGRYRVKTHYGKSYFNLSNTRFVILSELEWIGDLAPVGKNLLEHQKE